LVHPGTPTMRLASELWCMPARESGIGPKLLGHAGIESLASTLWCTVRSTTLLQVVMQV
jgi:hypothetical protein